MSFPNNQEITLRSLSPDFGEIEQEFVLDDKPHTCIVFNAQISPKGVRGTLSRMRKNKKGERIPVSSVDFRKIKENEGVQIELSSDAIREFVQSIGSLSSVAQDGTIPYGETQYQYVKKDNIIVDDSNKREIIQQLLDAGLSEELWKQLAENSADLALKFANDEISKNRKATLEIFRAMLDNTELSESDWQSFFEENTWIFGYGLRYQILNAIQGQPYYGGKNVSGSGGQRGDFLTATSGFVKYTCLVEIKKPTTNLLMCKEYRNGAWSISEELAGAVAQVQSNCLNWETEESRSAANYELLTGLSTVAPKGIVVIGNTSELDKQAKKQSFELFRRELRNPEIITYDELYERAKFIVGDVDIDMPDEDELPF